MQQERLKKVIKSIYGNGINIQIVLSNELKADRAYNNYFKPKKELSVGAEEYKSLSSIGVFSNKGTKSPVVIAPEARVYA